MTLDLIPYFESDFQKEATALLTQSHNTYTDYLRTSLSLTPLSTLIQYGLNHLSDTEDDNMLGTYFLLLSNLHTITPETRDFLMDVMVFAEDKHSVFKSSHEIDDYFKKKILPLLSERTQAEGHGIVDQRRSD